MSDKFVIRLFKFKRQKKAQACNLCKANKAESKIILQNGFLLHPIHKYVASEILYVLKDCQPSPTLDNFADIISFLDFNGDSKIAFCNMLNHPSIPNHWHIHFISKSELPKYFVNYWSKISKKQRTNHLSNVCNTYGNFSVLKYANSNIESKSKIVFETYEKLAESKNQILLAFSSKYILTTSISEGCKMKPVNMYGYFPTTDLVKFNNMKTNGVVHLLQNNTKPIKLFSNMTKQFKNEIAEIFKQPDINYLSKKWYSTMKIDQSKIAIKKVLILPNGYASTLQIHYIESGSVNTKPTPVKFVNVLCLEQNRTEQNRTEQNRTEHHPIISR